MDKGEVIATLWGVKNGRANWREEIITTIHTESVDDKLEKASAWAKENGYGRLRLSWENNSVPDFAKTVNI